jgi:hypothetical protein
MLNQQTIEKLHTMKLHGIADAFRAQLETTEATQLSFEERFALLVDQQWLWKENRALARHLRAAHLNKGTRCGRGCRLPAPARPGSQIGAHTLYQRLGPPTSMQPPARAHRYWKKLVGLRVGAEGLPRRLLRAAQTDLGTIPRTGRGACRRQHWPIPAPAFPHRHPAVGRLRYGPLKDTERRDFLQICDDRYQRRSLILTSQMPVSHWHEQIGDPTIADSILDRLIHNAYRIELKGESMRKKRRKPGEEESQ